MANVAVTLFAKAKDDLEAAEILLPNINQHDNSGAHLCKAAEKFCKAYLEINGITNYPTTGRDGHNLELIFNMLDETDFPVGDFLGLLKLQVYDSRAGYRYIDEEAQLDLKRNVQLVRNLKDVVLRAIANKQK